MYIVIDQIADKVASIWYPSSQDLLYELYDSDKRNQQLMNKLGRTKF